MGKSALELECNHSALQQLALFTCPAQMQQVMHLMTYFVMEVYPSWKKTELDGVGHQFEPYLTACCICTTAQAVPVLCGLQCCSQTLVVIKATLLSQAKWLLDTAEKKERWG